MTAKQKRKAPAATIDPVFAAISEHKALIRESDRLEKSCKSARAKAEKSMGNGGRQTCMSGRANQSSHRFTIDGTAPSAPSARLLCEWPGWNRRRSPVPLP